MHKGLIIEFLELTSKATDEDIKRRAIEKKQFFLQLQANAPNAVLKTLHTRNVEKVSEILAAFGIDDSAISEKKINNFVSTGSTSSTNKSRSQIPTTNLAVAWLVRHTEMMQIKSFELVEGINTIGRDRQFFLNIVLDDDPYISRHHAVIEIVKSSVIKVFISDGMGSKPSKNGIYLNGNPRRIEKKTPIQHNDTIQIGNTKLVLILPINDTSISILEKEVDESEYMKTVIINLM